MAYGSGYAGGYADVGGGVDNETLEGQADLALTQTSALVMEMALASTVDLAMTQTSALVFTPMAAAGQSDLAITQASDLVLVVNEVELAGQSDIAITQAANLVTSMALAGQSDWVISQTANVLIFEFLSLAGEAALSVATYGSAKLNRPPTAPPSTIQQAILKRRSFVMPTPVLDGASGRPS